MIILKADREKWHITYTEEKYDREPTTHRKQHKTQDSEADL